MADNFWVHANDADDFVGLKNPRDTVIQIILSVALGVTAFTSFCILRPRWAGLYAARKRQKSAATSLPDLPTSLLGWIPIVFRISDQQLLASAGLDAYVFLQFFKMAIKFFTVTAFFALVVIKPVHDKFPDLPLPDPNKGHNDTIPSLQKHGKYSTDYLWMYLIFAYVFTALAMYLIISESRRVIEIRQEYLGSQSTITDRTIRLSGIPSNLQSEDKIKEFIEELEIGKVESVMLCRKWEKLDKLLIARMSIIRKLEEAWTVCLGVRRVERSLETLPVAQPAPPNAMNNEDGEQEDSRLLVHGDGNPAPYMRKRPTTRVWYGTLKMRYRVVDAIDYYEERLRKIDDEITEIRKKQFPPTTLAFVTMDSVATCQMAIQAVLDPSPLQLLANPSPAPTDVVWGNCYLSRSQRMTRAWSITLFITFLTVFWTVIYIPVAGLLNIKTIERVWPQLAEALQSHEVGKSLIQTQIPTLVVSLLNVIVPYLYDWLSNQQGMISQGDVELSLISKNFFFTFFNFFVVFTVLGTASNFFEFSKNFNDSLKDVTNIANTLALSLTRLQDFYINFIILQGLGLFPLRLLEFGSVALYPISLIGAKTPRDYAELVQPPIFSYGFYLPQTLLIFIICTVYSVLRSSEKVLLAGLAYFIIGYFVHKYQLLYAMDHRQHSTGRGWIMCCNRVIIGIGCFQLTTAGQLALRGAAIRSALIAPLLALTIWFSYVYNTKYGPLMHFIALKSIRRAEHSDLGRSYDDQDGDSDTENIRNRRYLDGNTHHQTVDESRESGLKFVNPSLIMPLDDVWIADPTVRPRNHQFSVEPDSDLNV